MNDNFTSPDFYQIDDLLSEEHKLIRESTRQWVSKSVCPIIEDYAQKAEFPKHLIKELGEIGAFGPYIPQKYGGAGLDQISYGIMMQEIERGDSGIRSTASVQSSLVMYPIWKFGSEEQKEKFLPKLATGEMMGCFGLTEPDHGSNPSGMITNFKSDGEDIILNGSKMWISNSPFADIAVVWAKDENKRIHGIIVERGMAGFSTPETHNKWSLRASATGELIFDNVRVPKKNILPGKSGLGAPLMCLDSARFGISWGAIGVAMDCYNTALKYSLERVQFGKPRATIRVTPFLKEIAWRLAILKSFLTNKPSLITRETANSGMKNISYSSSKIKDEVNYKFIPFNQTIKKYCNFYVEDLI